MHGRAACNIVAAGLSTSQKAPKNKTWLDEGQEVKPNEDHYILNPLVFYDSTPPKTIQNLSETPKNSTEFRVFSFHRSDLDEFKACHHRL